MVNMKKVLLVEPSDRDFYVEAKIKEITTNSASLTLATLAASILEEGHDVQVIDLSNFTSPIKALEEKIEGYNPDVIGVTASTPLFSKASEVVDIAKRMNPKIIAIAGGPHVSAMPQESLERSSFDILVIGEGDITIKEVLNGVDLKDIKGIAYRKDKEIIINERRALLDDLDKLPLPAWHLFDVSKSVVPKSVARNSPVCFVENSRGCVFNCLFCSKHIFSRQFRTKSADRFILEIKHLKKHGFKEFHLTDDCFTTDMDKAEKICDEMIKQDLVMPWVCITGIRVDRVNPTLLKKMRQAGCYRVFFGIESGSLEILKRIRKQISLDQVREAVKMANDAGIETWGSFMIGLPGETEETMQQTIDFAKSLPLDMAKLTITIPLPATDLYNEYVANNQMLTLDWNQFNMYSAARDLYKHDSLEWDVIEKYYKKFYRSFYWRPKYIIYRFFKDLRDGMLMEHARVFVGTKW